MRLNPEQLREITSGRTLPSAQKRWFSEHFNVDLPFDSRGPIITPQGFEALVAKSCGLNPAASPRPQVRTKK